MLRFVGLTALSITCATQFSGGALAQTARIVADGGIAIATPDATPGAADRCPVEMHPIKLSLQTNESRGVYLSSEFETEPHSTIRVRRGLRTSDYETTGGLSYEKRTQIRASGAVFGCLGQAGFVFGRGELDIHALKTNYEFDFRSEFDNLINDIGAGLAMSFERVIVREGPEADEAAMLGKYHFSKDEQHQDAVILGNLRFATSAFPWQFPALNEGGKPLDATLQLRFRFFVLDGGLPSGL